MTAAPPSRIRILIADDHPVVRDGLRKLLKTQPDFETVGEAGNGREAVAAALRERPDVVLMDLLMPELDGLTAVRLIRQQLPATQVVVLTTFAEERQVREAVQAGAAGYLLKDASIEELARAVRGAVRGERQYHPEAARFASAAGTGPSAAGPVLHAHLTQRERAVLRELAAGRSNKEIAQALAISITTVKGHVASILNKLGVSDRTQAAIYAVKHGLSD